MENLSLNIQNNVDFKKYNFTRLILKIHCILFVICFYNISCKKLKLSVKKDKSYYLKLFSVDNSESSFSSEDS